MTTKQPQAMPTADYPYQPRGPFGLALGNAVRDRVTGFAGHATAYTQSLSGCTQYCITPQAEPGKAYPEGIWLDWQRLEVTGPGLAEIGQTVHTARADGAEPAPYGRQG